MLPPQDEGQSLVRKFSDRSRKATRTGNKFLVPHKFTPDGEVIIVKDEFDDDGNLIAKSNFDPKRDISKLSLDDFRLLAALQEKKWDKKAACESLSIDLEASQRRLKKLSYFEFEEIRSLALASTLTPAYIAAKHVQNLIAGGTLNDSEHKSLVEGAKITGAYKPTTNLNVNVNAFVKPQLSPEQEKATREFFDAIAVNP